MFNIEALLKYILLHALQFRINGDYLFMCPCIIWSLTLREFIVKRHAIILSVIL